MIKLSKGNIVLLVIFVLFLGLQIQYAFTSACPGTTVGKSRCWGPNGFDMFGLTLNIGFFLVQLGITLFLGFVSFLIGFGKYRGTGSYEIAGNNGLKWFFIMYLIVSFIFLIFVRSVMY